MFIVFSFFLGVLEVEEPPTLMAYGNHITAIQPTRILLSTTTILL